jgi:hypothetical protein
MILTAFGLGARHRRAHGIRTLIFWLLGGLLLGIPWLDGGCAAGRVIDGFFRDSEKGYQVRLPPSPWTSEPLEGAVLAFRAPALRAGMALGVECRPMPPDDWPWVTRHLFFGLRDTRVEIREPLDLHGAEAVRTRLTARLDEVPVEVEAVSVRHTGCRYDFLYVAPAATFPQGQAAFDAFVESWTPMLKP